MADYTLSCAIRNISDMRELEAARELELQPHIYLSSADSGNSWVIDSLGSYLGKEKDINYVTVHYRGPDFNLHWKDDINDVKMCIDAVHRMNELCGGKIKGAVVHAGSVHTFEKEHELRKKEYKDCGPLDATFNLGEYLWTLGKARSDILELQNYANERGTNIIVENVPPAMYDIASSMEDKPETYRKDRRWGKTPWMPELIQYGPIGVYEDLKYLTEGGIPVCIDIEHLDALRMYSEENNVAKFSKKLTDEDVYSLKHFKILVRKREPIIYEKEIDPIQFIQELGYGAVPTCHLGGQRRMIIRGEDGIPIIDSHRPIEKEEGIAKYIEALRAIGCGNFVIEIKAEDGRWEEDHRISAKNVRSILDQL